LCGSRQDVSSFKDGPWIGLSVAVVQDNKIRIHNYGTTRTDQTLYEIGSISKTFANLMLARARAEFKEDNDREQEERAGQKRDWEQAERDREQAERDREQSIRDRAQGEQDRKQAERDQEQSVRDREQGERDREQGQRDREQGERDRKEAEEERRMMRELLDDLVTEKIVLDVKSINSFVLTDSELMVNDKKQTPQLQQKMKDKYGKWAKCGISYGCCQTPGTTIHFNFSN
jgi:colicin import membrane protein